MIISIMLFFIYCFGIGLALTFFLKNLSNFFERNIMRIGIGLCALPFLTILFNLLHIPIDWRIFLVLSLIAPAYVLVKKRSLPKIRLRLTKTNLTIFLVLLISSISLLIYLKGAFTYPYLEDDDSWAHALGVKYVAVEKTIKKPQEFEFQYMDPYPPGYDFLMGLLHQTNNSVSATLKFFNTLIISLALIFFYFFMKEFTNDKNKALFSTFVLAVIPCFLSHFIWAHSLIIPVFFVTLYCFEMLKHDKKWVLPSMFVFAGMMLIQPTQIFKLGSMLAIYFIVKCLTERRFKKQIFVSMLGGFAFSLLWWATRWKSFFGAAGLSTGAAGEGVKQGFLQRMVTAFFYFFNNCAGSATRPYSFNDFFVAKPQNMINNPIGIGIVLSLLLLISMIAVFLNYKKLLKKENSWIIIAFLWLIFTFLGVNSCTFKLPIGLFAFRFWMLLAIAISMLCVLGLWFLFGITKRFNIPKIIVLAVVIVGILLTSGYQKYAVNTAYWPPGAFWTSMDEVQGYVWLRTLPQDTKVFSFVNDASIIGFDKYTCAWCPNVISFKKSGFNKSAQEIHVWLKDNDYKYLVLGGQEVRDFGYNETINKMQELGASGMFRIAYQNPGVMFFEVI